MKNILPNIIKTEPNNGYMNIFVVDIYYTDEMYKFWVRYLVFHGLTNFDLFQSSDTYKTIKKRNKHKNEAGTGWPVFTFGGDLGEISSAFWFT